MGIKHSKRDTVRKELIKWLQGAKPDYRLPPESELALRFGVSRPTVRKVIDDLVRSENLKRIYGRGAYVAEWPAGQKHKFCLAYPARMERYLTPYFNVTLQQLELLISKRGGTFILTSVDEGNVLSQAAAEADGIIVMCRIVPSFLSLNKPMVSVYYESERCQPGVSYVFTDCYLAGLDVCEYLISLGHSRIAFIGDTEHEFWAKERYRGVCSAASQVNLAQPVLMNSVLEGTLLPEAVTKLKDANITAVVCANDELAIALTSALHKAGLRIPEDISVTGFDDQPNCVMFQPSLTTVKQPMHDIFSIALNELEAKILNKGKTTAKKIMLPGELIIRGSAAPPKKLLRKDTA